VSVRNFGEEIARQSVRSEGKDLLHAKEDGGDVSKRKVRVIFFPSSVVALVLSYALNPPLYSPALFFHVMRRSRDFYAFVHGEHTLCCSNMKFVASDEKSFLALRKPMPFLRWLRLEEIKYVSDENWNMTRNFRSLERLEIYEMESVHYEKLLFDVARSDWTSKSLRILQFEDPGDSEVTASTSFASSLLKFANLQEFGYFMTYQEESRYFDDELFSALFSASKLKSLGLLLPQESWRNASATVWKTAPATLENVLLKGISLSNVEQNAFRHLENLQSLNLHFFPSSGAKCENFGKLFQNLKKLEVLRLKLDYGSGEVRSPFDDFDDLALESMPSLEVVQLSTCLGIRGPGFESLKKILSLYLLDCPNFIGNFYSKSLRTFQVKSCPLMNRASIKIDESIDY